MVVEDPVKMTKTGKHIKTKLIEIHEFLCKKNEISKFARFASKFVNMTEFGIKEAIINAKYRQYIKKHSEERYLAMIGMYEHYKRNKEYMMSYYCKLIDEYFKKENNEINNF